MHACVYACMDVFMCVFMYVCIHMYMYMYMYMATSARAGRGALAKVACDRDLMATVGGPRGLGKDLRSLGTTRYCSASRVRAALYLPTLPPLDPAGKLYFLSREIQILSLQE